MRKRKGLSREGGAGSNSSGRGVPALPKRSSSSPARAGRPIFCETNSPFNRLFLQEEAGSDLLLATLNWRRPITDWDRPFEPAPFRQHVALCSDLLAPCPAHHSPSSSLSILFHTQSLLLSPFLPCSPLFDRPPPSTPAISSPRRSGLAKAEARSKSPSDRASVDEQILSPVELPSYSLA